MTFDQVFGWLEAGLAKVRAILGYRALPPRVLKRQPASPGSASTVPPGPAPLSDKERKQYARLLQAGERYGLATLTTPELRTLMQAPAASEDERILRVVRHPVFDGVRRTVRQAVEQGDRQLGIKLDLLKGLRDYGSEGFISNGLLSVLTDDSLDDYAHTLRVATHPEAQKALQAYRQHRQAYPVTTAPVDGARHTRPTPAQGGESFADYIDRIEREAFKNPHGYLSYDDTRPLAWEGIRYRCWVRYTRIAGSVSEKGKFVYLAAHAHDFVARRSSQFTEEERQNEFARRVTAALFEGRIGQQDWRVDEAYDRDRKVDLVAEAEKYFRPPSVTDLYRSDAAVFLALHDQQPNNPVGRWAVRRLRPHSAGWAASR